MQSSSSKAVWYSAIAAGAASLPAVEGAIRYTDVADVTAGLITFDLNNAGGDDFRLEVAGSGDTEKSNLVPLNGSAIALSPANNADRMLAGEVIGEVTPFST